MLSDNFIEKHNEYLMFSEDACYFHLSLSQGQNQTKSLLFYKENLIMRLAENNCVATIIKVRSTDIFKYAVYKMEINQEMIYVLTFEGNINEDVNLIGEFICPADFYKNWKNIFEASIYLIDVK